VAFIGLETLGF
jgi:hypothetical protein